MARYKEYNWTLKTLIARVDYARQLSESVGAFLKTSIYSELSDALNAIEGSEAATALIDAVNDYNELNDAVKIYLFQSKRTKKRARDLVLETLVDAALKRFDDIKQIFFTYTDKNFDDETLNVFKDLITSILDVTEGSAAKC